MATVFFELNNETDEWEKVGKVEDGEIVEDSDGILEHKLEGLPLQDGYLSRKFTNQYFNARLTEDVWEKEKDRTYIDGPVDIPDDVEIQESEHGAYYYER